MCCRRDLHSMRSYGVHKFMFAPGLFLISNPKCGVVAWCQGPPSGRNQQRRTTQPSLLTCIRIRVRNMRSLQLSVVSPQLQFRRVRGVFTFFIPGPGARAAATHCPKMRGLKAKKFNCLQALARASNSLACSTPACIVSAANQLCTMGLRHHAPDLRASGPGSV